MKKAMAVPVFLISACLLTACGQMAPVMLPPPYIAQHATKEVPLAPSRKINSNVNVVQTGI